jgi:hypothetical protein
MTKKELKAIVSKWLSDRAVDWSIDTHLTYGAYMVRVITVSKYHIVFRSIYWVREDGSIDWDCTHVDVLG